jgi:hypothetical protein
MSVWFKIGLVFGCLGVYGLQSAIDRRLGDFRSTEEILYLPSGKVLKALSLGHNGLLADVYWMRAVQYYGGRRLRNEKRFDLLEPLLQISTTLDPQLMHAYRFGSVFLSEPEPIGANQPHKAIELLRRGLEHNPEEWQLHRDIGFTYYWYLRDYKSAAKAFLEGSKYPKSAKWMKTFAAELLAKGGSRDSARFLWQEVYNASENQQMKTNAWENLIKLTADEEIEKLQELVQKVEAKIARKLTSLDEFVQLGIFKQRPLDPKGFAYALDAETGKVHLAAESTVRKY